MLFVGSGPKLDGASSNLYIFCRWRAPKLVGASFDLYIFLAAPRDLYIFLK